jgi:hypothetical protein
MDNKRIHDVCDRRAADYGAAVGRSGKMLTEGFRERWSFTLNVPQHAHQESRYYEAYLGVLVPLYRHNPPVIA